MKVLRWVLGILLGLIGLCVIALLGISLFWNIRSQARTEVYRGTSEDGRYSLTISEIGEPDFPFGPAHYEAVLRGESGRCVILRTDVHDDGGRGGYAVEWQKDAVRITMRGSEQDDAVFLLPYPKSAT